MPEPMAMQPESHHLPLGSNLGSNLSNCLLGILTIMKTELPLLSAKQPTSPPRHTLSLRQLLQFHFLQQIVSVRLFHPFCHSHLLPIDSDMSFIESHFHPCR